MVREQIDVNVELHDALSRPADHVEESVTSLHDSVGDLDDNMKDANYTTSRWERALDVLKRTTKGNRGELDKSSKSTRAWSMNAKAAARASELWNKGTYKAEAAQKLLMKTLKMFKFSAIATGMQLIVSGVAALGGAAYAAVSGLVPMVGVLGALPAIMLALAATLAVVKLGFSNIGAALKVVSDPASTLEQIHTAMAGLSPAARTFVLQLNSAKKATTGWRDSIQAAMLPGFTKGLERINSILPTIGAGLTRDAKAVGRLGQALGTDLATHGSDLETIFGNNEKLINKGLNPALRAALSILLSFAVAGGPLALRFATWLGESATHLADIVQQGRNSGQLTAFLQRAGDLAAGTAHVLTNVVVALFNIGKESQNASAMMGHGLTDVTDRWRKWTETVEGKNAIRQWFNNAMPPLEALGRTVVGLAKAFNGLGASGNLTTLINQINTELVPAISSFVHGAASQLGPALVDAATAFVKFESLLSYSPLAELLLGIAAAAVAILNVLTALPGPLKFVVASLLAMNFALKLLNVGMPILRNAVAPMAEIFEYTAMGAADGAAGLTGFGAAAGYATGAAEGLAIGLDEALGILGGPLGLALIAATVALGYFLTRSHQASQATSEFQGTLDQQTASLTKNTREMASNSLEKSGAYKAAQTLGINLGLVTAAATGNTSALAQLNSELDNYDYAGHNAGKTGRDLQGAIQGDNGAMTTLRGAVGGTSSAIDDAVGAQKRIIAGSKTWTDGTKAATSATAKYSFATHSSADQLDRQAEAAQRANRDIKELNDTMDKDARTMIAFKQAIADSTKTLNKNKHTLDINSQAGRDNKSALLDVAEAAAAVNNAAKRQKAIAQATAYITKYAEKAGMGTKAAEDYAQGFFDLAQAASKVPKTVQSNVSVAGIDPAISAVKQLQAYLDGLHDKTIHTTVVSTGPGGITSSVVDPHAAIPGSSPKHHRREGGGVWPGQAFTVGEAGPELYLADGRLSIIGAAGQEQRHFSEAGVVLPNEFYEAVAAAPTATATAVADREPLPPLSVIVQGNVGESVTLEQIEEAAMRAYRRAEKEKRERR